MTLSTSTNYHLKSIDSPLTEEPLVVLSQHLRTPHESDVEFMQRMSGNPIPSSVETSIIHSALIDARRALARLQDESRILQRYIEGQRYLVAPIRRLPPEIVGEIMLQCRPVHDVLISGAPGRSSTAVKLGRICRIWRDISLSIPALWSSFNLTQLNAHATMQYEPVQEQIAESLHLHLTRSRGAPLNIKIKLYSMPSGSGIMGHILNQLVSHSTQWCDLRLVAPHSALSFLGPAKGFFPMLEYIHLTSDAYHSLPTLLEAPRLHTVTLLDCGFVRSQNKLPWTQIKTLKLSGDAKHFPAILRFSPQVETITMIHYQDSMEELETYPPIVLSDCHCFELRLTQSMCNDDGVNEFLTYEEFFGSFSLPAARQIMFSDDGQKKALPFRSIASFLGRAGSLQELILNSIELHWDHTGVKVPLLAMLANTPKLVTLKIYSADEADSSWRKKYHELLLEFLLKSLNIPRQGKDSTAYHLVPRLESLELRNLDVAVWLKRWPDICSMIRSRARPRIYKEECMRGLRHLLLSTNDHQGARRLRARLQRFVAKGMEVIVEYVDCGYDDESDSDECEELEDEKFEDSESLCDTDDSQVD
ncbi:hypothetical protein Hypma_007278 [Hypsizygus marmoreus]|uniref:F-box domain-containing protein n=1 Tax=Hypsizygus marmoreus TaxID=39966 RepID=A0A369KAB1_HYPMA|nr:hypothetical protein Hypma_007278 [Hypsizygus marmoreus]